MFLPTNLTYNEYGDLDYFVKHRHFRDSLRQYSKSPSDKRLFLQMYKSRKDATDRIEGEITTSNEWEKETARQGAQEEPEDYRAERLRRQEEDQKRRLRRQWDERGVWWSALRRYPPGLE